MSLSARIAARKAVRKAALRKVLSRNDTGLSRRLTVARSKQVPTRCPLQTVLSRRRAIERGEADVFSLFSSFQFCLLAPYT